MCRSFVFLGRYTPKYFILFVAMVNDIVSLISFSVPGSNPGYYAAFIYLIYLFTYIFTTLHLSTQVFLSLLCAQSCPTLCNPRDCNLPGSSVQGIFQASILEWTAISFSRGSSQPRDRTCVFHLSCVGRRIFYHWATWETQVSSGL